MGQEELTELDAVCLLCVSIFEIFVFNNKEAVIAVSYGKGKELCQIWEEVSNL